MFSLQEISQNESITNNLKATEDFMDKHGYFDPSICNIYRGLKRSVQRELSETLRKITLKEWLTSTTLTTGSLGAGGLNYLVPTWVANKLTVGSGKMKDIAPLVAALYLPDQPGDAINWATIGSGYARRAMGGSGSSGLLVAGGTSYTERLSVNIDIANEMLEDNQFGLMEAAVQACSQAFNQASNEQVLKVLARVTGTTGGNSSKQTASAGADTTSPANLAAICCQLASSANGAGDRVANTMVLTPESWWDALVTTAGHPDIHPGVNGFDAWYGALDTLIVHTEAATMGSAFTSNRLTDAKTIVFDRSGALGVARCNWLRIEHYSDPVKDLAGAVVTGKQAVGELVNGAIGVLSET